jgi:hypothetical protein
MKPADVHVPPLMRHLPKDARGYPTPVIVMMTDDGKPIYAANDESLRQRMIAEDRCHICGLGLLRGRWYIGGALSTCAEHGLILDGGMHDQCAHYALKVCPYLAAPVYGRLVGKDQLAKTDRASVMVIDTGTEGNSRPELFVALMAVGQEESKSQIGSFALREAEMVYGVRPKPGSVRKVEVWQHGRQIVERIEIDAARDRIDLTIVAAGDRWRLDVQNLWGDRR